MSPNVTEYHTISPLRHMGSTPTTCRHIPVTLGGSTVAPLARVDAERIHLDNPTLIITRCLSDLAARAAMASPDDHRGHLART